ncbi:efflux RND transporter periplasmic adaptor subunit [Candidatus Colwellia aromaticivorans]|uniref:efflux RND transporter periplasmic adaptor subunit n=1 Tax=Candidatus Colwellia aromaticivorans TaxID=2267621 RepID=UPI000DF32202|nr:efflux RND transporter periplasmic adaptor subunit [Candidatus Colwellia aromaticivorans]
MNSKNKSLFIGIIIGLAVSGIGYLLTVEKSVNNEQVADKAEKIPLYWVAPMDANFKKDAPGLSPMGMDLIPVYADSGEGADEGPGTIRISPDVINNLGVRTVSVQYKNLHNQIDTVGYVTYDEDKLVHIHPRVDGWVEKLYVTSVGSVVTKDQPLYDIYSPALVNAQEELLLALERKNGRLIKAAENRLVALQLPRRVIAQLKKSRKVQQNITFYAPQNGVVENLNIRTGFFVKPGATLMSIGDLSEVWLEAEVFERQAAQVHVGTKVTMRLDYLPGKEFGGKVDFIYPTLDVKTRTVKVRIRIDNKSGEFKPNMFAEVAFHTSNNAQGLLIPREALIRTGNQNRVVLALGGGSFKSIAVTVGRFDSDSVEILSGLSEGEEVVSSAQFLLDSESSKSSDFMRMNHSSVDMNEDAMDMSQPSDVISATTSGTINSVMMDHRMVNISRAAIDKWQRPAATVDFLVDDALAMENFIQGNDIDFTFEVRGDDFVITHFDIKELVITEPSVPEPKLQE